MWEPLTAHELTLSALNLQTMWGDIQLKIRQLCLETFYLLHSFFFFVGETV